jgi:hypothetical protein
VWTDQSGRTRTSPSNLSTRMRSRVTFALDFEGHRLGALIVPAVFRQARKGALTSYRNLKARLERGD